jgi:hypothetical protein
MEAHYKRIQTRSNPCLSLVLDTYCTVEFARKSGAPNCKGQARAEEPLNYVHHISVSFVSLNHNIKHLAGRSQALSLPRHHPQFFLRTNLVFEQVALTR